MGKKYYLHRISNEWKVSYPLFFDANYLTIGWKDYHDTDLMHICRNNNREAFNDFMKLHHNDSRNRWWLWHFSQFKEGDYIVVPLFGKEFAVCEVTGNPENVHMLDGMRIPLENRRFAHVGKEGIVDESGKPFDIGFVVPIKILNRIPREYATSKLVSRMKIQHATANIDDIQNDVERAAQTIGPIDLREEIIAAVSDAMQKTIKTYITPQNLESTVMWYMKKMGADRAWIPSKNERGKENGADADVIAEFYDLGLVYYIQVKNHDEYTNEWAVTQINEYKQQRQEGRDGITHIPWVVSTADDFTPEAKAMAEEYGVRLINGDSFKRMILKVGLDGIETVKNS